MAFEKTYLDYIKEIDLVSFLSSYGYKIDKKKSSRNCTVMKDDHGVTFLVRRNAVSGEYYYTNPNDARDKGNVVTFVCNYHKIDSKKDYKQVNSILAGKAVLTFVAEPFVKKEVITQPFDPSSLKDYKDQTYLLKRGISSETLNQPIFKGRIYSHSPKGENLSKILNTAFPVYSIKGEIIGAELKNAGFKGSAEDSQKSKGIWHSALTKGESKNMYLCESAVDALSLYQLYFNKGDENAFVSMNGTVTPEQILCLEELFDIYKLKKLYFSFDNDLMGMFYGLLICCTFKVKNVSFSEGIGVYLDKANNKADFKFSKNKTGVSWSKLFSDWAKGQGIEMERTEINEGILISLKAKRDHLVDASMFLASLRGLSMYVGWKLPLGNFKDFNDELNNRLPGR